MSATDGYLGVKYVNDIVYSIRYVVSYLTVF